VHQVGPTRIGELSLEEWLNWRDRVLEASDGLMQTLDQAAASRTTQIYATLDDVGKREEDGMCAVVGYVATRESWFNFNRSWMSALAGYGLQYLHTADFLNKIPNVDGRKLSDRDVYGSLAPFISVVNSHITSDDDAGFGICVVTEYEAYDSLTDTEKTVIRKPEVHSFEMAVGITGINLKRFVASGGIMALQFDETKDAAKLYNSYRLLKEKNDSLRHSLSGICFLDDKLHPPMQAADMLGNLTLKAWRRWKSGNEMPLAFRSLALPGGLENRNVLSLIYTKEKLKQLAATRLGRTASIVGA